MNNEIIKPINQQQYRPTPPINMVGTLMAAGEGEKSKVVHAGNEGLSPYAWVISLIAVIAIPLMLFIFLWKTTGSTMFPFLLSVVSMVVLGKVALDKLSGDGAANKEIKESNKTERERIKTAGQIATLHYETEQASLQSAHALAIATLEYNAANQSVGDEQNRLLLAMSNNIARLLDKTTGETSGILTQKNTFVPATSEEGRTIAKNWLYQLVEASPDGYSMPSISSLRMPWNEPENREVSEQIKDVLLRYVLEKAGTTYGWKEEISVPQLIEQLRTW